MSAEAELELQIKALDPQQFERLVFDLALAENPGAIRLSPPDEGADTLVLGSEGRRARVWQAKRYTRSIVFKQCEHSLQDAIAGHDPESVTFVFAKDLTAGELRAFKAKLRAPAAEAGVAVEDWGVSAVRARLQSNPRIRIRYLGYDERTLLDIYAGRRVGADPIGQALGLEEAFGAEDPAFEFEVELTRRALPEPQLSDDEHGTVMLLRGEKRLRVVARARDARAGPVALWSFAEGKAGQAARRRAMLATARGDVEVAVDEGLAVGLEHAPKRLRETFEHIPPGEALGRIVFKPGPGIPVSITAHAADRSTVTRDLTVYPFPPTDWHPIGEHDRAYVGLDGSF